MIEVIIPGIRHGEAVIDTSGAYNGCFCYVSGINADGKQKLELPSSTPEARRAIFPVNKYYFSEDYSDTSDSVDKLTKGDQIIYYEGGEYLTDKFAWTGTTEGFGSGGLNSRQSVSTSNWGRQTYVPGTSTAAATLTASDHMPRLYVATGTGYLQATSVGTMVGAVIESYVGFATGLYMKDSAHAYLRYRISPGTMVSRL